MSVVVTIFSKKIIAEPITTTGVVTMAGFLSPTNGIKRFSFPTFRSYFRVEGIIRVNPGIF